MPIGDASYADSNTGTGNGMAADRAPDCVGDLLVGPRSKCTWPNAEHENHA